MPTKAAKVWVVNILSFVFFAVLAITGLANWLLLPRGYRGGGFWSSLRHFFVEVHELAALFFIVIILIHLALHWTYIKSKLDK